MSSNRARAVRPDRSEYAEYYHTYVSKVPDGDIVESLAAQGAEFVARIESFPEERGDHRYAEGKWSVKEVIGHLVDTERVMGYRALAFARGDTTPLPGIDQDVYVGGGNFADRTLPDLAAEFEALRVSHLNLFASFDDTIWMRAGTASDCGFTTRAVAWIMAGHVTHHAAVLTERYL
jgi:hypothetical protein